MLKKNVEENIQLSFDLNGNILNKKNEDILDKKYMLDKIKKVSDESKKIINVKIIGREGKCIISSNFAEVEKNARGLDKQDGFIKAYYASNHVNRLLKTFESKYSIENEDARRIDPLIFRALCNYDEQIWINEKVLSHKAEVYALTMSEYYEKEYDETENEYEDRCKNLRKEILLKNNIKIEYDLSGMVFSNKVNVFDRMQIKKYANIYGIKVSKKNIDNARLMIEIESNKEKMLKGRIKPDKNKLKSELISKVINNDKFKHSNYSIEELLNQTKDINIDNVHAIYLETKKDLIELENKDFIIKIKKIKLEQRKKELELLKEKQKISVA